MEKKRKFKLKIKKDSLLGKIVLVTALLLIILNIFRYAAYFKKEDTSKITLVVRNETNIELKHDLYIDENDIIYMSKEDMKKFLEIDMYEENTAEGKKRFISIIGNNVLEIIENENHVYINDTFTKIKGKLISKENTFYFPISELTQVYNISVEYNKEKNTIDIESLLDEKTTATVAKNTNLKYKMTWLSKNIKNLEKGEKVIILEEMDKKWARIKTDNIDIGYIRRDKLKDINKEKSEVVINTSEFGNFDFENDIIINFTDSTYESLEEKIANFDTRKEIIKEQKEKLSKEIASAVQESKNVGLRVDITSIENKDNFYKFLRELKANINSNGCFLIIKNNENLDKEVVQKIANIVV